MSFSDKMRAAQGCARWVGSHLAFDDRHSVLVRAPKRQAWPSLDIGESDRLRRDAGSLMLALGYRRLCT